MPLAKVEQQRIEGMVGVGKKRILPKGKILLLTKCINFYLNNCRKIGLFYSF